MEKEELTQLFNFFREIDKEKFIGRQTYLTDGVRKENDAEHAWHMAIMTVLLAGYANEKIDVLKTVTMLLIHDIVEIDAIRALSDADQIVIACGGGGIPVIPQKHILKGASAVIEKDSIAGKLASDLQADTLVILTGVDKVYRNFGKDNQEPIERMTVAEAKAMMEAGEFEAGTMLPKIEAAVSYLEKVPGGSVLITSMEHVKDALKGKNGTVITA